MDAVNDAVKFMEFMFLQQNCCKTSDVTVSQSLHLLALMHDVSDN